MIDIFNLRIILRIVMLVHLFKVQSKKFDFLHTYIKISPKYIEIFLILLNFFRVQFSSHAKEETRKIKRLSKNLPRCERVQYRAKHISTQYRMGPNVITPTRLWAIIYLALRIHNHPIQLGDMLRYVRNTFFFFLSFVCNF